MATAGSETKLTPRQAEIFRFIREEIKGGMPPTRREIMRRFGIRSPNGIQCHIHALVKKRKIEVLPYGSRGIRIVKGARA